MTAQTEVRPHAARTSLRAKLVRTIIATLALVATSVLITVAALHFWTARHTLSMLEERIRESITRKGQGLVTNHAQALRGLVADNAFSDVQRLVEGTMRDDPEVIYGLFVGPDLRPWAYESPTTRAGPGARSVATWSELGLPRKILRAPHSSSERRQLFAQEIFQFAAPVRNDEGIFQGTILYGVSGAPLQRALDNARRESRRSLMGAVGILGVLTIGTSLIGMLLGRKAAARITQPLAELTRAATAIAGGDRKLRVDIRSEDELQALGQAFNQMVGELNESYVRLEGLNHSLEQRVHERTQALAERNRDLRLVLDTVTEGLLTVSRDGILAQERSAMIDRWFGPYAPQTRFVDFLSQIDRDFAMSFELGYEALLEGVLPPELCLQQLPTRVRFQGRELAFGYLPIGAGEQQQGLLVVINDVTEQLTHAQQEAEQRELLSIFQGLTRDRAGFLSFFDEAGHLLEQVASGSLLDLATQKRLIHTLKGNASLAGLNVVAQLCHQAEDEIAENQRVQIATIATLRSRWLTLTQAVSAFLGERGREVVELPAGELERLREEVEAGASPARIAQRLAAWRCEPIDRPFQRLASHARALSGRLGKGDVIVDVEGHGLRLDPRRWASLWHELVHVVRNAVDHGFESRDERHSAGKAPRPRLRLAGYLQDTELVIEIEDDGRGIDWTAVRQVAMTRGLAATSEADLTHALFTAGLTTRTEVSATSGRGVGLTSLYRQVQELQGQVAVSSRRGAGTMWRLSFPRSTLGPSEGTEVLRDDRVVAGTAVA
jgi:HAMP domain-containing protein/HPt (histidine-containing phosphotransfer) domain-containing protein/two-component sensor histidine kinase